MAVKRTKPNKNRQRTTQKKRSSVLSYFLLGGLTLLGGAGWYHNTYEVKSAGEQKTATREAISPTPNQKPSIVSASSHDIALQPAQKIPTPVTSVPVQPKIALVAPKMAPAPVPDKPDTTLPPKARFAANNAANVIYAKNATTIYANADSQSKIVATVKAGQEMRSYEHQGSWHRVVVPTTDIIGWANEASLSTKSPAISNLIDRALTGSINR